MRDDAGVFTPLADDYARYRPGYPAAMLDALVQMSGLAPDWVVADIGSGTGNLARLFLAAGHQVYGVEPNREMREAGERRLAEYPAFRSLDGAAECMPLAAQSVDLVAVGQALHWFDVDAARGEFRRILRCNGWVAVAWNDRLPDVTAFTRAYAAFTHNCISPSFHPAPSLSTGIDRLFGSVTPHHAAFPHTQFFNLTALLGRARSSGYLPQPGADGYAELAARLTDLFNAHQQDGLVTFHYRAQLHVGRLGE